MTMAGQQTIIENTFLTTIPKIYPTTYQALLTSPSTKTRLTPTTDSTLNPFWILYTNINQILKVKTPHQVLHYLLPTNLLEHLLRQPFLQANSRRLHHALHQVDQQLWPQSPLQVLEPDPTHHQEHRHVWLQSHLPVIQD